MTTYLAPALIDQGYTGATGSTPYKPATTEQITQLHSTYNQSLAGLVSGAASPAAIHININFDGTQNNGQDNGAYLRSGEVETNIWNLSDLQRNVGDQRNTIYKSGMEKLGSDSNFPDSNFPAR